MATDGGESKPMEAGQSKPVNNGHENSNGNSAPTIKPYPSHSDRVGGEGQLQITPTDTTTASVQSDGDNSVPIMSATPRPSITAAIRRGSFYGDATPRASIVDVLSSGQTVPPPTTVETASSEQESDTTSVTSEVEAEEQLCGKPRLFIEGFLHCLLERLELLAMLPGATARKVSSLNLTEYVPEGLPELALKTRYLNSANLIKYSLGVPSKISKFSKEVAYFIEVMKLILKEVEENGTIYQFIKVVEDDALYTKNLPDSIAHIKQLKDAMEMLENVIEAEAQAHKEARRQWARNLVQQKLELKELRKQNMIQYRYKADIALATGDLSRRKYDVELIHQRAENIRLKNDLEVEKRVYEASVEFLKKQNMALREEAVALQAGMEVDTHNMDHMLEKMKLQRKDKEEILTDLEPRYLARHAELETAKLEAIRKQEEFFANQGPIELQTFAALKIQRIWRGFLVRKVWRKVLRRLKKKRLASKKKGGVPKKGKGKKKK